MKKILLLLFSLIGVSIIAQQEAPPQGINYQAVVYANNNNTSQPGLDAPGQVLWNEDIGVQFSILSGSATGTLIYKETHSTSTDEFGMFDLVIGQGMVQGTQSFNMIDWGSGYHFLKVEVDKTGGTDYVEMSNQQLWSVPYTLYAGFAGNGITDVIDNGDGSLTFIYYNGSSYTTPILEGLGDIGPPGPQGNDGASAYEIWLSQGNTGTEADFLNGITGPQGPAGNSFADGTVDNQILFWDGTSWVNLNPGSNGQILTLCNGNLTWTTNGVCPDFVGSITELDCGSASITGTLTEGQITTGVNSSVPYTGGDGGTYDGQSVISTGVTGLTATITAGTFANGSGLLVYSISGTPSSSGIASFSLLIGGQSCVLSINVEVGQSGQYPSGSVFCSSGPTEIVDVTNPTTGKIWMDRNLGAVQVATSITDADSYGDYYQWGRESDGHQCANSNTTTVLSSSDQVGHGDFIIASNTPYDWRSPQNDNLWQGLNGINNPCPLGYRIPTEAEFQNELATWAFGTNGAFSSILKIPTPGYRRFDGNFMNIGSEGRYRTSTISGTNVKNLLLSNFDGNYMIPDIRNMGGTVRCIKD